MRRHQTPFTALTSRSSAQPPLGTAASHRRDGEERPRCHRSRTALSCHHAAVPAAPRCCPRSISVAKNRCSAFGASGHRILPGSVPALRSHPLSRPGNLPPCPARFLFSLCLSCSLFWLFKAPRGSLGIIIFYYFFFSSRNVSVPPQMHHMGCSQQPLHIRAQRRRRQPMGRPSLLAGSATGGTPAEPPAATEQRPNTDYR